jgi:hypothetical protein
MPVIQEDLYHYAECDRCKLKTNFREKNIHKFRRLMKRDKWITTQDGKTYCLCCQMILGLTNEN